MKKDKEEVREKTVLYFRDPTLVRIDCIVEINLLERNADDDTAVAGYFACILCEMDEQLQNGYVLYKKSTLGKKI